jgi:hypothetical protein
MRAHRRIYTVFVNREEAEECASHHLALGRWVSIYRRMVRAEGLALPVHVVCGDIEGRVDRLLRKAAR